MLKIVSAGEEKSAGSANLISAESGTVSSDKGRADERAFAIISTPRPSQPSADQSRSTTTDVVERVELKPTVIRPMQSKPSAPAQSQADELSAQYGKQHDQQEVKIDRKDLELSKPEPALGRPVRTSWTDPPHLHKQEQQEVEGDHHKTVEFLKQEPAGVMGKPVPFSRTNPAYLHKAISQRIEQSITPKHEESTTNTTHEVLPSRTKPQQLHSPERQELKVDQIEVECSKPEPAAGKPVPLPRTDPAQLHKLISQRIEQSISHKQEESAEVRTQYSRTPFASATEEVTRKEVVMQKATLKLEPAENQLTEEGQAAENRRTDVRQVRVM